MARLAVPCAALLLALAACGGGGGEAPAVGSDQPVVEGDTTCGFATFREDALRLVNARRAAGASCGDEGSFAPAAPLGWHTRLELAAYGHSADMAANDYFSHTGLDGRSPADRVTAAGYDWRAIGENIAAGYPDVAAVVDGWMASPGHCANLMNPGFRDMGLACAARAGSRYGLYYTLELATPR